VRLKAPFKLLNQVLLLTNVALWYSELIGVTDGSTRIGEDTMHKEGPYSWRLLTLLAQSPDTSCESLCQLYTQAHKLKRMRLREVTVAVAGAASGKTEGVHGAFSPYPAFFFPPTHPIRSEARFRV